MENQFKGIERAKEYSKGKSPSNVFTESHEADFIAGYNKGIEDSKTHEMLEMLIELVIHLKEYDLHGQITEKAEQLIKEATNI